MQYRHALVILSIAGLMLLGINEAAAAKCLYGGQAIGAEAAGFDALVFQIFGNPPAIGPDGGIAAFDQPSISVRGDGK